MVFDMVGWLREVGRMCRSQVGERREVIFGMDMLLKADTRERAVRRWVLGLVSGSCVVVFWGSGSPGVLVWTAAEDAVPVLEPAEAGSEDSVGGAMAGLDELLSF